MIESTTDISSEMNSMVAELEQNGSFMSRELLQIRVNEASKCSKIKKFPIFKVSFAKTAAS